MILAFLAACAGRNASNQTPPTPTRVRATLTPAPTPLPPLPTLPPLGSAENPLVMIFVVEEPEQAASAAETLSEQYSTADTIVEVRATASYAEAYRAMCDGSAQIVSLNAFATLAATQAGCGDILFLSEVGGTRGVQGQMLSAVGRSVFTVEGFRGQVFCRTDANSVVSWIIPSLVMRARRLDPFVDLKAVIDKNSDDDVVDGIFRRECNVGATALGAHEGIPNPNPTTSGRILVIEELPTVPHDAVLLTLRQPEDVRAMLLDLLAGSEDDLAALLDVDALIPVEEDSDDLYGGLLALFEDAGVDPAALAD